MINQVKFPLGEIVAAISLFAGGFKIMGWIDWSWLEITSAYLICNSIVLFVILMALIQYTNKASYNTSAFSSLLASFINVASWTACTFLAAMKLDGHIDWSLWIVMSPMLVQVGFFFIGVHSGIKKAIKNENER